MAENENPCTEITLAGNWAKPANTLIEKISDATGAWLTPWQSVRIAKAEVKANEIRKLGEIELNSLEQRTMQRLVSEESKRQQNIETITQLSLDEVSEDAKPEEIDNDWLTNYFEKTKNVSNEIMQKHWAKILSSEANDPGKFSKKTIEVMYQLDKADAELFASFCNYMLLTENSKESELVPFMLKYDTPLYKKSNITFDTLMHLKYLGLISFESMGYQVTSEENISYIYYFDKIIEVQYLNETKGISIGYTLFTQAGRELSSIVDKSYDEEYFKYLVSSLSNQTDIIIKVT